MVFGKKNRGAQTRLPLIAIWILLAALFAIGFYYTFAWALQSDDTKFVRGMVIRHTPPPPTLDKAEYDRLMYKTANYPVVGTSTASTTKVLSIASSTKPWPVATAPYPKYGALLPFNRIVAYYGNFLSKGMGVLGEYPEEEMLAKLKATVADWQAADPSIPVIPAIHYIVVTAQASAGRDGMYRARMSDSQVEKALEVAKKVNGIVFLDFQVGFSTVEKELPQYEQYLSLPNVHVGVDPEFSMKGKHPPGKEIGTMDATDINWAANYLASLVKKHDLPPKILMIHRFTHDMLTNYRNITPLPEVQIVVDMDGWGDQAKKIGTYTHVVAAEPVQFTGFKLFYKNDLFAPSTGLFTPEQVLKLSPIPSYIQYQ